MNKHNVTQHFDFSYSHNMSGSHLALERKRYVLLVILVANHRDAVIVSFWNVASRQN